MKIIDILGIPWDFGSSYGRPGARYAPKVVREMIELYTRRIQNDEIYDVDKRKILDLSGIRFNDLGNINLCLGDLDGSYMRMEQAARKSIEQGHFLVAIGGDHSISFPVIKAFHNCHKGNIGIIQFDAHLDLMDHSDLQGSFSHSSEIRRASELERVNPENIVQIGVRGYNFADSFRFVVENNITQFTSEDVYKMGPLEIAKKAIEIASKNTDSIYMTFDIDVFEPAYAPGTGGDDPFGLNPYQVFTMLEIMAPFIGAMDIAEVNPSCDRNDISSLMSARLFFKTVLAKYCLKK